MNLNQSLNRCTFVETGGNHRDQYYKRCFDCHAQGEGACLNCISVCHDGHNVELHPRFGSFFCDCSLGCKLKGPTTGIRMPSVVLPPTPGRHPGSYALSMRDSVCAFTNATATSNDTIPYMQSMQAPQIRHTCNYSPQTFPAKCVDCGKPDPDDLMFANKHTWEKEYQFKSMKNQI